MSDGFVTLRSFSESELIFDHAETKGVLKFFFQGMRRADKLGWTRLFILRRFNSP